MKWAQYEATTGKRIKTILEEKNDKWVRTRISIILHPRKK